MAVGIRTPQRKGDGIRDMSAAAGDVVEPVYIQAS